MKRDRVSMGMILIIPIIQLILFGFAINTNPKHLPTALITLDHSQFTRTFVRALENSDYFRVTDQPSSIKVADRLLAAGKVLFVVTIPADFTERFLRDHKPQILVEADATDPVAVTGALAVLNQLSNSVFHRWLIGSLSPLKNPDAKIDYVVHAKYNPESITQYNIVPALLGVVLTMTLVMVTAMAITRERERGTMESLLATPVRPLEVMIGKILPYVMVGYVQVCLILLCADFIVGFYVSFLWHAEMGAMAGSCIAINVFFTHRARYCFERKYFPAYLAEFVADICFYGSCVVDCCKAISQDVGLMGCYEDVALHLD